jgi:hypothetical protein
MGRDFKEEKFFSEQIERLLAGKEVSRDLTINDDLASALQFARKMIDLRVNPSPRFASGLKSGLLQKLAEKEALKAAGPGWFQRLIPRTPVFQAVAVLAVVCIIGGILWASLFRPAPTEVFQAPGTKPPVTWGAAATPAATTQAAPAQTTAAPASVAQATMTAPATLAPTTSAAIAAATSAPSVPATAGGNLYLRSSAAADKSAYLPGESVNIVVNLKNISAQPVVLENYPPSISLMSADSKQPVYTINSGKLAQKIDPGQTVSYVITWDQTDAKGRHASPGSYYLELEEVYRQGVSVPLALSAPVYFEILPSSSAAGGDKKIIEVINAISTVNGITVTLQRIETDTGGISVTAFISPPPDYVLKEGPTGLFAAMDYRIPARYSLDGSWIAGTLPSFVEYYAGGMKHTWYIPAVNPAEIENLTFIIDNIAGWAGPWEFKVKIK